MPLRSAGLLPVVLALVLMPLIGCSSPRGGEAVRFAPGSYPQAFDAAREALIDEGFALGRVDAQAGVIETLPKQTAGLATPWHTEQSSPGQEVGDFFNAHRRQVRVIFEPVRRSPETIEAPGSLAPPPQAAVESFQSLRVRVVVERRETPGRRIEPESIRRSSGFVDPSLAPRRMLPIYWVAVGEDEKLGERLGARIASRLERMKNGAPEVSDAP